MTACQKCKQELEENAAVCPNCGARQKNRPKKRWENRPLTSTEQDQQDKKYLVILVLIVAVLIYVTLRQYIF